MQANNNPEYMHPHICFLLHFLNSFSTQKPMSQSLDQSYLLTDYFRSGKIKLNRNLVKLSLFLLRLLLRCKNTKICLFNI